MQGEGPSSFETKDTRSRGSRIYDTTSTSPFLNSLFSYDSGPSSFLKAKLFASSYHLDIIEQRRPVILVPHSALYYSPCFFMLPPKCRPSVHLAAFRIR